MVDYHLHADIQRYFEENGVPVPLPTPIRDAFAAQGMAPPVMRQQISIVTPPHVGDGDPDIVDATTGQVIERGGPRCAHCGRIVGEEDNLALHAVAGAENARDADGNSLRLLVRHCDTCAQTEACSPHHTTPNSGHPPGSPAGFCEFLDGREAYQAPGGADEQPAPPAVPAQPSALQPPASNGNGSVRLSSMILPIPPVVLDGLRWITRRSLRLLRAASIAAIVLGAMTAAIQTSQGQQQSTLKGDTGSLGAQGDSTAGHGYNSGAIRVYTGSAPATANAAETGTKLADVTLPNPAFGAPSAAVPSVLTANAISNSTILATGTAGYARCVTNTTTGVPTPEDGTLSTTQRRLQFAVGTSGSDMNFNTLSLVSGGTLSVTSFTITHGA